MHYRIRLSIDYQYASPVQHGRHLVCVLPRSIRGLQTIFDSSLTITPVPGERLDRVDHFGNKVTDIGFRTRHDGIVLDMDTRLERLAMAAPEDSIALDLLPDVLSETRSILGDAPLNFTTWSPRVRADADIAAYARSVLPRGISVAEAVMALGAALHDHMTFDATATEVDTPAAEAFANRRGVCQDFTHIMLIALRTLGIPASYVSGYLRTFPPEGMPRLEGADAMHAWVRAWCGPQAGWIEYDPTNRTLASEDHIVAAYGRDYSDVSPIKGVVRTSGAQVSKQSVDVQPIKLDVTESQLRK